MELCPRKTPQLQNLVLCLLKAHFFSKSAAASHRSLSNCFQIQAIMFSTACIVVVLLVSGNLAAPLACEDLLRPVNQVDPAYMMGRWASVASSLQLEAARDALETKDSFAVDVRNSSYTMAISFNGQCNYYHRNITLEGPVAVSKVNNFTLTATLRSTTCPDCLVLTFDVESPSYKSVDLYLLSRRREVTPEEMAEFMAQLECLKMSPPVVMDPTQELCPEQPQQ